MIKARVLCICLLSFTFANSQEQNFSIPLKTVKWAPAGLLAGNLSLQGEYNLKNRHSFTAKIGLPLAVHHNLTYEERDASFTMKATSFLAGFRTYLTEKNLAGFYLEPFFNYISYNSTGIVQGNLIGKSVVYDFTNHYESTGFGIQLGIQFLLNEKFVIDLFFFGPEVNSSIISFTSIERDISNAWTSREASDAEKDIRDFINKIPFIKNRFELTVDGGKHRVEANFIGALPGIRTGVSIGVAF